MEDSRRSMIKDGLSYISKEIRYLIKEGKAMHIPYLFIYVGFRFAGFLFGRKQKYLPLALRKKLSLHPYYWEE